MYGPPYPDPYQNATDPDKWLKCLGGEKVNVRLTDKQNKNIPLLYLSEDIIPPEESASASDS